MVSARGLSEVLKEGLQRGKATSPTQKVPRSGYRYDLDGLRGIAIAFVVLFHVFVGKVSGGVDVFLLLSGYFFLGSQLRYADRPDSSINPWWPFWRTLRRLLPALVVVLGVSMAIIMAWIPRLQRIEIANQAVASLFYTQNWELAAQGASYEAASAEVSPFQHLWSMAVQGQFYLFAIALSMVIILIRRYRPEYAALQLATPVLAVLTSVSFFSAVVWHFVDQSVNYYSTFTRFWELGLGALLALHAPRILLSEKTKSILAAVGLFMVLSTGFIMDGAQTFPGAPALYPILGACLIILGDGKVSVFLSRKWMRWLGDIAYPLYLWHWPLLIMLTAYFNQTEPSIWLGIAVIVLSVGLAQLTNKYIEKPMQQQGKRPVFRESRSAEALKKLRSSRPAQLRAVAGIAVVVVGMSVSSSPQVLYQRVVDAQATSLDPSIYPGALSLAGMSFPEADPEPNPYVLADTVSPAWAKGCMSVFGDDPSELAPDRYDPEFCTFGNPESSVEVYLVGGSHAEQWISPLDTLGQQNNFKVIPLVRQSCPTFVEDLDGIFSEDCAEFNEYVIERLAEVKPDLVVSNSTRPLLEKGRGIDEVPESYITLWDFLEAENIPFLGLRDNPWFIQPSGEGWLVSQCYEEERSLEDCSITRDNFYALVDPAAEELASRPNMLAVDTSAWFCPDDICVPVIGNVYVYRDGNHMSDEYAQSLTPLVWGSMRKLLGR
ncbi:acyltransferase family protein [Corynebacterium crudilactis]|uniref:Acyltransferase n=1 Tax=Corynebacterium crudilactis TaxID=1652495 RepID=A0A172QRQ2_9CORY|nr:acyltransferase family protein [Corynebacterium crudilactis]ANE03367.1 acyltransferase [Corynebacterium crudilactis]